MISIDGLSSATLPSSVAIVQRAQGSAHCKKWMRSIRYGGVLIEAANAQASYHPFGNTQGAVLYLLMQSLRQSKNPEEVNYLLGGILVSVLNHKHFKKSGCPAIDLLRNTVIS